MAMSCPIARPFCAAFIVLAISCGDGAKSTEPTPTVARVTVSRDSALLAVGGHVQVTATHLHRQIKRLPAPR